MEAYATAPRKLQELTEGVTIRADRMRAPRLADQALCEETSKA